MVGGGGRRNGSRWIIEGIPVKVFAAFNLLAVLSFAKCAAGAAVPDPATHK